MSAHLKALISVLILAALLVGVGFWYQNRQAPVAEGPQINLLDKMKTEGVPVFKMQTLNGSTVDLEEFKNQVVIINFWASWCEPCVEEVPSLISLIEKLDGQVKLIAISGDSGKEEIVPFIKSFPGLNQKNISVIWDDQRTAMKQYGVERLPETFIVGKDLKLVKKVVGAVHWDHPESIQYFKNLIQETSVQ
jgi:thiol-disulfide isomerase/thioredoxin